MLTEKNLQPQAQAEWPLISVVICNYNYGRFVGQAIESVFQQTYPRVELIVVDDGSTDESHSVIRAYGDRIKSVFQPNQGQGPALSAGIALAKGEFISLLDADDYFHPDKLQLVVNAFLTHPNWVQITHPWIVVDREGTRRGRSSMTHSIGDVTQLLLDWGKYGWGITSSLSYRQSALAQLVPIPSVPKAADIHLTTGAPFQGEVGALPEHLMFYRIHGKNRCAHSGNVEYFLQQREGTAACINRAVHRAGLSAQFDLARDVDYRCFRAVIQPIPLTERIAILVRSVQECVALRRTLRDSAQRLLQRAICLLYPQVAREYLALGLKDYVRLKLYIGG
jgi:hypothetical protein